MVLSSITELDRINLLKAVTSISEIKIFLNQEIEIEIEMELKLTEYFQFVWNYKTINSLSAGGKILLQSHNYNMQ